MVINLSLHLIILLFLKKVADIRLLKQFFLAAIWNLTVLSLFTVQKQSL